MSISALFTSQLQMFCMMFTGLVLRKFGVLTPEGINVLSDVMMDVLLPCSIISAYFGADLSLLRTTYLVILLSIAQQVFTYLLSLLFWRTYPQRSRAVLRYSIQFSNSGFIGLPIIAVFYGAEGLFFASFYTLPINVFMWCTGLPAFLQERRSASALLRQTLTHPCMVAVYCGLLVMIFPSVVPDFLQNTIRSFGSGLTPVSMLVVGSFLLDADWRSMFSRDVLFICAIRLFLLPALVVLIGSALPVSDLAIRTSAILSGMPVGSMVAILAHKYHGDKQLAGNCIVLSTLLSLLSLPIIYLALEWLL